MESFQGCKTSLAQKFTYKSIISISFSSIRDGQISVWIMRCTVYTQSLLVHI